MNEIVRLFLVSLGAIAVIACVPANAQTVPSASDKLPLGPFAILMEAPSVLDLGAGVYDLAGNAHRNEIGVASAEFRYGWRFNGIGPAAGVIANGRAEGWVMSASTAILSSAPSS